MKITFLGTGTSQGVPVIACTCPTCTSIDIKDKRLRTSAYIEIGGQHFVIDIGPDFRQQMLNQNLNELDAILITHEHNDHVIGLDDVRPFNFIQKKSIPIYGLKSVLLDVRSRFSYIFKTEKYPGSPSISLHYVEPQMAFEVNGVEIIPLAATHGNIPVLGFLFEQKLAYLTDVKHMTESEIAKIRNIDVLVLNALHHREHHSHLNLKEAVQLIHKINPKKTYLTHMSHRMGLHSLVESQLPQNIHLAYDGLQINLT